MTKTQTMAATFEAAEEHLGAPVDVLVNNPGIMYSKSLIEPEECDINRPFDTSLKDAKLIAQESTRHKATVRSGVNINIASTAG